MISFDKSLKLSSDNGTSTDRNSDIHAALQVIGRLRQKGQFPLAERTAKDYLKNKAFSIEILALLVDLLVAQKCSQQALDLIEYYQHDINKKPKCKELFAAQAKALLAIDKRSASLELIQTTTEV